MLQGQLPAVFSSMTLSPASGSFNQYVSGAPEVSSNCQIHTNGHESYQVGARIEENVSVSLTAMPLAATPGSWQFVICLGRQCPAESIQCHKKRIA
jgi:hypothetical protein